ncbi:response regulator [Pseudotabrizicola algicola]|uniref:histidine kinase n=1 Tax=Pseudotabrizicola algicola TaxID=2709381 RepID=A0A6B3RL68_9RHOB|nr:response regulator [Pseudotabrizicola algicola]NEX46790.1 response regulator [Pseudotabrizicola algicola]
MVDLKLVEAFVQVQNYPCAVLQPNCTVISFNSEFKQLFDGVFVDDRLKSAARHAARTSGSVPASLLGKDHERHSASLTALHLADSHLIYLQVRPRDNHFSKITQGLTNLNESVSRGARHSVTLQQVLEATADGVLICNVDGKVLETNKACKDILGEVKHISSLLPEYSFKAIFANPDRQSKLTSVRIAKTSPAGQELTLDVRIGQSRSVDGAIYVVLIADRTDRTRLEQAMKQAKDANANAQQASARDAAKSRFLSTMSHEIRTPLHGVISALELMDLHGFEDQELRALHKIATTASEEALHQVNRALDFTKFEARLQSDSPVETFDPAELVKSVIDQMKAFAVRRGNTLTLSQTGLLSANAVGDQYLFHQIVQNLIGNALKFTSNGMVNAHLGIFTLDDGRLRLDLDISDTGVGFDMSQKERLLKEFETGKEKFTKIEDGAGIGLSLVNRAVIRMGGVLSIDSVPGRGSSFRVIMDLGAGASRAKADLAPRPALGSFGLSVLVVDDNMVNRSMLARILTLLGCKVSEAESGKQALTLLAAGGFDLVFMDISMPDMNGIEATQAYFRSNPTKPARIVGLTAHVDKAIRDSCLEANMDDVLSKPLKRASLEDYLKSVMVK